MTASAVAVAFPPAPGPVVWVTPSEYAAIRRMDRRTVYRYLRVGRIPGAQRYTERGSWRIPVPRRELEVVVEDGISKPVIPVPSGEQKPTK